MKFLVDVCAGRSLAKWLSERGHDVKEVRERDPRMEDDEILAWAYAEGRVIVTVDKDFGALAVALVSLIVELFGYQMFLSGCENS
ncbi:MAG: DUF5615 family PIN-like protein [Armatimonadota bacterium]